MDETIWRRKKLKSKLLMGLSFIPMLITLIVLRFVPDRIPAHYDTLGNIDRYGSKYELLLLPGVIVLFSIVSIVLLHYFKKKQLSSENEKDKLEAVQNQKVMFYVAIGTLVIFTVLHFTLMISAVISVRDDLQTMALDIWMVLSIIIGLMFIVIGNILPKSRRNGLLGVRTKWSLASDDNWLKSNHFGGFVLMITGLIIIVSAFVFNDIWSMVVMLAILIISAIIIIWYSWFVDSRSKNNF